MCSSATPCGRWARRCAATRPASSRSSRRFPGASCGWAPALSASFPNAPCRGQPPFAAWYRPESPMPKAKRSAERANGPSRPLPAVIAIHPPPGSHLLGPEGPIALAFNQPVDLGRVCQAVARDRGRPVDRGHLRPSRLHGSGRNATAPRDGPGRDRPLAPAEAASRRDRDRGPDRHGTASRRGSAAASRNPTPPSSPPTARSAWSRGKPMSSGSLSR